MLFSQLVSALAPQAPEALSAQAGGPGRHCHRELIFVRRRHSVAELWWPHSVPSPTEGGTIPVSTTLPGFGSSVVLSRFVDTW